MVSSTPRYAPDDPRSCEPDAPDPIWELVALYRRICREKSALQEEILRELREGADAEAGMARMALAAMGHVTRAADRTESTWAHAQGNYGQGGPPAIPDVDSPQEDPIRNVDLADGHQSDRSAAGTSNLLSHAPVDASPPTPAVRSPTFPIPITPPTLYGPNVEPSHLPADGSVFAKYDKMIMALRIRSPPITLSFIPREEIPWPLLPSHGVFPVAVSGRSQIELDNVAEFAAGFAIWRGKPLGKTLNILLGHWISMDKRLRGASEDAGQEVLQASPEVSETLRCIANVRSTLFSIVAEQDPLVFTTYEQLMASLAQARYQLPAIRAIPWPVLPSLGEQYPVPVSGRGFKHRQIGRFVRAYGTWKLCSKADICGRMLLEWQALHTSCIASDARTQQCIKGVVNYLAEPA